MSQEAMGSDSPEVKKAVRTILELKQFPIALWTQDYYNRYNAAFSVFWSAKPGKEEFSLVLSMAPLTAEMLWIMTHDK